MTISLAIRTLQCDKCVLSAFRVSGHRQYLARRIHTILFLQVQAYLV